MGFLDYVLHYKDSIIFKNVGAQVLKDIENGQYQPDQCTPVNEMKLVYKKTLKIDKTGGRPVIITTSDGQSYVYKYDEQQLANEYSLVANLLMCHFGLETPKMMLMKFPYTFDIYNRIVKMPSYAQSIEYVTGFKEFSIETAKKVTNYCDKLGKYVAFFLYVSDFDNFLFLGRFINNIRFADDPEYSFMNLWDNPIINEGNLLIMNDDFMLIDIRPDNDPKNIVECHHIVATLDYKIVDIVGTYMQMSKDEIYVLLHSLRKNFTIYMNSFDKLYNWANNNTSLLK